MKNNNNLCAIIHNNFDRLHELTHSYNKATLLDKIIYWWQISTYQLEDGHIWFTRCLDQIARDSKISKRSVERYLQEFSAAGLISKTYRLFKKKHLYIRVTEKLLTWIAKPKAYIAHQTGEGQGDHLHNNIFFEQNGVTVSANLADSIYKEKDLNVINNNTVSEKCNVNNFENPGLTVYPIEATIGERITDRLKNYIKGMLSNVQKQYDLKFSNPNKLFAEVVFSVTQENHWQGVDNPHHRVNIIAKLLREKHWRTPKGFYNHWDVGQIFRNKERTQMILAQQQKMGQGETNQRHVPLKNEDKVRLEQRGNQEYGFSKAPHYEKSVQLQKLNAACKEISLTIQSEESYLRQLEFWLKKGKASVTQEHIELVAIKIAHLYVERQQLSDALELESAKTA